jgi:hypothetical protein
MSYRFCVLFAGGFLQMQSSAVTTSDANPSTGQASVFTLEDFAHVEGWEEVLTEQDYENYRNFKLGRPVPEQRISDDRLQQLGYKSWRHYCLEKYMAYWG